MADCDRWLRVTHKKHEVSSVRLGYHPATHRILVAGVLERARRNDFLAILVALLCAVGVSLGLFCSVWRHGVCVMAQVQSTF